MNNARYLIEYRFQGSSKYEIRDMINHLKRKFHLPPSGKAVPHMTLAGGLTTSDERRLIKDFVSICSNTPLCKYTVDGFGYFENETGVIFIRIKANENLKTFRRKLSRNLTPFCNLKNFDHQQDFNFHASLAMNLNDRDFSRLKKYIDTQLAPKYKQVLIRATILKNSRILCEYDFLQRRLLNRSEALSKEELSRTFLLLNEFFQGNYDPNEAIAPAKKIREKSWLEKIPLIGKFLLGGT
jgi:2'-5' RNA ligase